MDAILDNNVRRVLQNITPALRTRTGAASSATPGHSQHTSCSQTTYFIGLTGLQGSGKSTWTSRIVEILQTEYGLRTIAISLDDLCYTHDDLVKVRRSNSQNKLLRTRGQPGTHDVVLARDFFESVRRPSSDQLRIPSFDKSRHNGQGDRLPKDEWPVSERPVDVVVFEGWCVGFQPLARSEVEAKWITASKRPSEASNAASTNTLMDHELEHLYIVNENLAQYCDSFMGPASFDALIHLDTDDLKNVYVWRLQQEKALIQSRGSGMSEEEVIRFVRGYMPAYELYMDGLRKGFFGEAVSSGSKSQIHVLLDRDRNVVSIDTCQ